MFIFGMFSVFLGAGGRENQTDGRCDGQHPEDAGARRQPAVQTDQY